jgi:hypothetical protein
MSRWSGRLADVPYTTIKVTRGLRNDQVEYPCPSDSDTSSSHRSGDIDVRPAPHHTEAVGGHRHRWSGLAAVAMRLLLVAAFVLLQRGADLSIPLSLIGVCVGIVALLPVLTDLLTPKSGVSTREQLNAAKDSLAIQLARYWATEVQVRHLRDPDPLVVRWLIKPELSDQAVNIDKDGQLNLVGRTDQADVFVREFLDLDRRRLVILGKPGMGKTTLAVLMLREMEKLRAAQSPSNPVPVFLSMSDWNLDSESLDEWLGTALN